MKAVKYLLILSFFTTFSNPAFTQNKKISKAYATFDAGEYYTAIDQFKEPIRKLPIKRKSCIWPFI